jgi:hypothetical protein
MAQMFVPNQVYLYEIAKVVFLTINCKVLKSKGRGKKWGVVF